MTLQTSLAAPKVTIHNGKAITTTDDVAAYFGKQPHHVVQKVESLECSEDFIIRNFSRMIKNVQLAKGATREVVYYEMTKDGFVFLVVGFTGKKAAAFKEAYIAEFNRMEAKLYAPTSDESIKVTIPSEGRWLVCYQHRHHRVINIDGKDCVDGEYIRKLRHDVHLLVQTLQDFGYRTLVMSGDASPTSLDKPLIEKH
ncbi:Rha family transcriptional regulator [Sodalis sp. (in: enterobacteria)]|uniref:Rha family transcriptional regulator n=1 Tax=Sodalis sp. (in: enterobacteria) TaxID=1898979 RepID=UPI003F2AE676